MAQWYCGSAEYAAVAPWSAAQTVAVGAIRRQLATPAVGNERCFRCTTPGTTGASEPAWSLTKGSTTSDNGVVWTEITGNSAYQASGAWAAPHARMANAAAWMAAGDDMYVSSDHAETQASAITINMPTNGRAICVTTANVPPTNANLAMTASVTMSATGGANLAPNGPAYYYGINFYSASNGSGPTGILATGTVVKLENCTLNLTATTGIGAIGCANTANAKLELLNCKVSFAAVGQMMIAPNATLLWRGANSGLAPGSVNPTYLVTPGEPGMVLDGVDLSTYPGTIVTYTNAASAVSLINCKLNASATIANIPNPAGYQSVAVINCDSGGAAYRHEKWMWSTNRQVIDTTVVRAGGASDGATPISWKITTSPGLGADTYFETFDIAIWVAAIGSQRTATIEMITDGVQLSNTDISVEASYMGTAGSTLASIASSLPAQPFTAASNLATSSAVWTTTGLTTPMPQNISLQFTPQVAGLVRFKIRVYRSSLTSLRVDPSVTIA